MHNYNVAVGEYLHTILLEFFLNHENSLSFYLNFVEKFELYETLLNVFCLTVFFSHQHFH